MSCGCQKCSSESELPKPVIYKITASEAQHITKQARCVNMNPIYQRIQKAAEVGDSHVSIPLSGEVSKYIDTVIAELKHNGFKATHDYYSDARDTWNNLIVEW